MPCPLCRKEFTIPDDGLSGTQKNFFMEKLLDFRQLSAGQKEREKMSDDHRKLVLGDKRKVSELWKRTENVLQRVEKEKNDVIEHLAGIEDEINTAADKSIAAIQRDREKLLSEVKSIKLNRVTQVETVKQELEEYMRSLEMFRRHCETSLSSGTACDVNYSLHERADELMKFDVIGHVNSSLPPVNVTFTSSRALAGDDRNLVGNVTREGQMIFVILRNILDLELKLGNICSIKFGTAFNV